MHAFWAVKKMEDVGLAHGQLSADTLKVLFKGPLGQFLEPDEWKGKGLAVADTYTTLKVRFVVFMFYQ